MYKVQPAAAGRHAACEGGGRGAAGRLIGPHCWARAAALGRQAGSSAAVGPAPAAGRPAGLPSAVRSPRQDPIRPHKPKSGPNAPPAPRNRASASQGMGNGARTCNQLERAPGGAPPAFGRRRQQIGGSSGGGTCCPAPFCLPTLWFRQLRSPAPRACSGPRSLGFRAPRAETPGDMLRRSGGLAGRIARQLAAAGAEGCAAAGEGSAARATAPALALFDRWQQGGSSQARLSGSPLFSIRHFSSSGGQQQQGAGRGRRAGGGAGAGQLGGRDALSLLPATAGACHCLILGFFPYGSAP